MGSGPELFLWLPFGLPGWFTYPGHPVAHILVFGYRVILKWWIVLGLAHCLAVIPHSSRL